MAAWRVVQSADWTDWNSCVYVSLQNSSTYWKGDAQAESLQRIYGISFPDSKQVRWKEGWRREE